MKTYSPAELWSRFQSLNFDFPNLNLAIDLSRSEVDDAVIQKLSAPLARAFEHMAALEKGAIANPDENRMVGHYWLRNAALAPNADLRREITDTLQAVKKFAAEIHAKGHFKRLLVIGIGGSALGPQFVAAALGHPATDKLQVHFFDNTDPDGMDRTLAQIGQNLSQTLAVVISKSGGTPESRNGMLVAKAAYEKAGLNFAQHAVAITGVDSNLDKFAKTGNWLARFPMWDWVGGRTSETSAVGLLPAALQGIAIDNVLAGAAQMDEQTRIPDLRKNPAALLALAWHASVNGKGEKDMVILPYKDRLELLSKYLQQLIMESLGKEKDLTGATVHQGIAVYGNKGSTDQHAYIQQLRDGAPNFFATFIEVLKDNANLSPSGSPPPLVVPPSGGSGSPSSLEVEPQTTPGNYLQGFFLGTRQALYESGRASITITIQEVSPYAIGQLIALYERAVGLYAALVNINAYHQPGVEAGKKAAGNVLKLQLQILNHLATHKTPHDISQLAAELNAAAQIETIYKLCEHLAANHRLARHDGPTWQSHRYSALTTAHK